jgi:hypothetical protein
MIISYSRNFIFIKTKKTAGSSMQAALSVHAGPEDVVTPLGQSEEFERQKLFPNVLPRNFSHDKAIEQRYLDALQQRNRRAMKAAVRDAHAISETGLKRHAGIREAIRIAGEEFCGKAYKFTIERHPYEKAVSLAWFERKRTQEFGDALESVLESRRYRNFELYTQAGKLAVDFVIRYENFAEDIPVVERAISGLDLLSKMHKVNAQHRSDRRPASEVLTAQQKKIVQETCHEEFELMGYAC